MTIEVRTADPKSKEGTALLTASHAYLASTNEQLRELRLRVLPPEA